MARLVTSGVNPDDMDSLDKRLYHTPHHIRVLGDKTLRRDQRCSRLLCRPGFGRKITGPKWWRLK
jgi:hypothetical protein